MSNYKRKGHRGRHKRRGITYNQAMRICGNSVSKQRYFGASTPDKIHVSASQRNRIDLTILD